MPLYCPAQHHCNPLSVSVPTIKRWLKRRRETGDVEPKPIPGRPPLKGAVLKEWLPRPTSRRTPT
jgi:transposase